MAAVPTVFDVSVTTPNAQHFLPSEFPMPEPRQHTENRGAIEEFLRRIPGFKGYLEKQYRRDSDALQRQWLAARLVHVKHALDDVTRAPADAGPGAVCPPFHPP